MILLFFYIPFDKHHTAIFYDNFYSLGNFSNESLLMTAIEISDALPHYQANCHKKFHFLY